MTLIAKTAYPHFSDNFLSSDWQPHFMPTEEEIIFVKKQTRTQKGRLTLLVLLKTHQYLGRTIPIHSIPHSLINYLKHHLNLLETVYPLTEDTYNKKQFYRYRQFIRAYLKIKPWSEQAEQIVKSALHKSAYTMSDPADLINVAIETLSENRYELPAFSTLERFAKHIRQQVHEQLYKRVGSRLTAVQKSTLEQLLTVKDKEWQSDFTKMKNTPGQTTLPQMRLWSQRLDWLCSIIEPTKLLIDIPHTKVRQFAAQTRQLELGDVKDISQVNKQHTFLLCFIHQTQTSTRDELVNMFLKRMRKTHYKAKEQLKTLQQHHRKREE